MKKISPLASASVCFLLALCLQILWGGGGGGAPSFSSDFAAAAVTPAARAHAWRRALSPPVETPAQRERLARVVSALLAAPALRECGHAADLGLALRVLVVGTRVLVDPRITSRSLKTYEAKSRGKVVVLHVSITVDFIDFRHGLARSNATLAGNEAVCAQLEI
jgi:hypothetical protein